MLGNIYSPKTYEYNPTYFPYLHSDLFFKGAFCLIHKERSVSFEKGSRAADLLVSQ